MKTYNILMIQQGNVSLRPISGWEIKDLPIECFAHKCYYGDVMQDAWTVSEYYSGLKLFNNPHKTKAEAIEEARRVFRERELSDIKEHVNDSVRKYGYANKKEKK